MSYSQRDKLQRKLKQASGNLDTALGYLGEIVLAYEEVIEQYPENTEYPIIKESAEAVAQLVVAIMDGIENLKAMI